MAKSSLHIKGGRILRELLNFSIHEYEALFELPRATRHKAAIALLLFYGTIISLLHLAIYPFIKQEFPVYMLLAVLYAFMLFGASSTSVIPMFFPALKKHIKKIYYLSVALSGVVGFIFGSNFNVFGKSLFTADPPNIAYYLAFMGIAMLLTGMSLLTRVLKHFFTEKTAIETELHIAGKIQKRLVPDISIDTPYCGIQGKTITAKSMGGDYFDIYQNGNEVLVCIGDVSGHGISAGLTMAMVKSVLQTEITHSSDPVYLMNQLNSTLYKLSERKTFVTFQIMKFDCSTNMITLVNAGHIPVIRKSASNAFEQIRITSLALTLSPESNFTSGTYPLGRGETFIFCTDGIAENTADKNLNNGLEKIARLAAEKQYAVDSIMEHILQETGDNPEDDMTLVIVRVK